MVAAGLGVARGSRIPQPRCHAAPPSGGGFAHGTRFPRPGRDATGLPTSGSGGAGARRRGGGGALDQPSETAEDGRGGRCRPWCGTRVASSATEVPRRPANAGGFAHGSRFPRPGRDAAHGRQRCGTRVADPATQVPRPSSRAQSDHTRASLTQRPQDARFVRDVRAGAPAGPSSAVGDGCSSPPSRTRSLASAPRDRDPGRSRPAASPTRRRRSSPGQAATRRAGPVRPRRLLPPAARTPRRCPAPASAGSSPGSRAPPACPGTPRCPPARTRRRPSPSGCTG